MLKADPSDDPEFLHRFRIEGAHGRVAGPPSASPPSTTTARTTAPVATADRLPGDGARAREPLSTWIGRGPPPTEGRGAGHHRAGGPARCTPPTSAGSHRDVVRQHPAAHRTAS
ncbi:hypothetical protein HBB16_04885 [Pseudonocardia sp. MCCB 268]|nr:hypothetical protein [Pseudonocardia cytotoxica]